MNLENILKTNGLSAKEASIYLALLELGSAGVSKLSQKTGIARSSCYEVLDALKSKNLVSSFHKKKVLYFSAENPKNIVGQARENTQLLENALPQLFALYGSAQTRPVVRFYQGKPGMKAILSEMLDEAKEILSFSSVEDLFGTLDKEFPEFIKKRIQKKIPVRLMARASTKAIERKQLGQQELRQVKFISYDHQYHGTIFIWGRKIGLFAYKGELNAVVIESEELRDTQRAMFEVIWNLLPR